MQAFEDFISTLPRQGERIIYPALLSELCWENDARTSKSGAQKHIVDQIGSNDPIVDPDGEGPHENVKPPEPLKSTRDLLDRSVSDEHQHDRRARPGVEIQLQQRSPLHLRRILPSKG